MQTSLRHWSVPAQAGGRLDVTGLAASIEAEPRLLDSAEDGELHVYTTHLLVAAKVSKQLEAWGLLDAARSSVASSLPEDVTVSVTLRRSAERILSLDLRSSRSLTQSLRRSPSLGERFFGCFCPRRRGLDESSRVVADW